MPQVLSLLVFLLGVAQSRAAVYSSASCTRAPGKGVSGHWELKSNSDPSHHMRPCCPESIFLICTASAHCLSRQRGSSLCQWSSKCGHIRAPGRAVQTDRWAPARVSDRVTPRGGPTLRKALLHTTTGAVTERQCWPQGSARPQTHRLVTSI